MPKPMAEIWSFLVEFLNWSLDLIGHNYDLVFTVPRIILCLSSADRTSYFFIYMCHNDSFFGGFNFVWNCFQVIFWFFVSNNGRLAWDFWELFQRFFIFDGDFQQMKWFFRMVDWNLHFLFRKQILSFGAKSIFSFWTTALILVSFLQCCKFVVFSISVCLIFAGFFHWFPSLGTDFWQ